LIINFWIFFQNICDQKLITFCSEKKLYHKTKVKNYILIKIFGAKSD
jgi:hypothetical protein